MTIKEPVKGKRNDREGEPEIEPAASQTSTGPCAAAAAPLAAASIDDEPEIPMVKATSVEVDSKYPVATVTSASCGRSSIENAETTSTLATTTYPTSTGTTVVTQQQQPQPYPTGEGTPIPQNARWVRVKHNGGITWSICAIVSTFTCCIMLLPCGVFAFLCPCDSIPGYEVDGQVYDERGRPLGHVSKLRVAY